MAYLITQDAPVNLFDAVKATHMTRTELHAHADRLSIPRRTLGQVKAVLVVAKKRNADMSMARLMANHGRLEPDAMEYIREYLS